jgi:hypothetical protein
LRVLQHWIAVDDVAAQTAGAPVPAQVEAAHGQATGIQELGEMAVAAGVFPEPVHQDDAATLLRQRQEIVDDMQRRSVGGAEGVPRRGGGERYWTPQTTS